MEDTLKKRDERIDELCADIGERVREVVGQLVDENDILREQKDRLSDRIVELSQTSCSYPTEDQLSPEMRARLMPGDLGEQLAELTTMAGGLHGEAISVENGLKVIRDALETRLMPEWMEWPQVGGRPVDLDQEMWCAPRGRYESVEELRLNDEGRWLVNGVHESKWLRPPVDADGVPIEVGDTVYDVEGNGHTVYAIDDCDEPDVAGGYTVDCHERSEFGCQLLRAPDGLTHKRPVVSQKDVDSADKGVCPSESADADSWEKLEEDAPKATLFNCCDYFGKVGCRQCPAAACPSSVECAQMAVEDIVRRAKALAGEP